MGWGGMVKQLENMETDEAYRCVPLVGEAVSARVRIQISAGLVDLNRLIEQATIQWGHSIPNEVSNHPRDP